LFADISEDNYSGAFKVFESLRREHPDRPDHELLLFALSKAMDQNQFARFMQPINADEPPTAKEIVNDTAVIFAMIQKGGGFVQKLGVAAQSADLSNLRRLKTAFADYWAKSDLVRRGGVCEHGNAVPDPDCGCGT
jgi:hypothetical protein